eukprot:Clim_evm5s198 gene=Clim_evmTU5s198
MPVVDGQDTEAKHKVVHDKMQKYQSLYQKERSKTQELQGELRTWKDKLDLRAEEIRKSFEQDVKELNEEVWILQRERDEAKEEVEALLQLAEEKGNSASSEQVQLEEELTATKDQVQQLLTANEDLNNQLMCLKETQAVEAVDRSTRDAMEAQLVQSRDENATLQRIVQELRAQLKNDTEEFAARLKEKTEILTRQWQEAVAAHEESKEEAARALERAVADAKSVEREAMTAELRDGRAAVQEMRRETSGLEATARTLKDERDELQRRLTHQGNQLSIIQAERSTDGTTSNRMQAIIDDLEVKIQAMEQDAREQVMEISAGKALLEMTLQTLKQTLDGLLDHFNGANELDADFDEDDVPGLRRSAKRRRAESKQRHVSLAPSVIRELDVARDVYNRTRTMLERTNLEDGMNYTVRYYTWQQQQGVDQTDGQVFMEPAELKGLVIDELALDGSYVILRNQGMRTLNFMDDEVTPHAFDHVLTVTVEDLSVDLNLTQELLMPVNLRTKRVQGLRPGDRFVIWLGQTAAQKRDSYRRVLSQGVLRRQFEWDLNGVQDFLSLGGAHRDPSAGMACVVAKVPRSGQTAVSSASATLKERSEDPDQSSPQRVRSLMLEASVAVLEPVSAKGSSFRESMTMREGLDAKASVPEDLFNARVEQCTIL